MRCNTKRSQLTMTVMWLRPGSSPHSKHRVFWATLKKYFLSKKQPLYLDLEAIDLPGLHFWSSYKTSAVVEQPDLDGNSSDGKHIGAIQYSALWLLCDGSCIPLYGSLFETVIRWLIPNGLIKSQFVVNVSGLWCNLNLSLSCAVSCILYNTSHKIRYL